MKLTLFRLKCDSLMRKVQATLDSVAPFSNWVGQTNGPSYDLLLDAAIGRTVRVSLRLNLWKAVCIEDLPKRIPYLNEGNMLLWATEIVDRLNRNFPKWVRYEFPEEMVLSSEDQRRIFCVFHDINDVVAVESIGHVEFSITLD